MTLISFSYRDQGSSHPQVRGADLVLDARALPNPYRKFKHERTGQDPSVQKWLLRKGRFRNWLLKETFHLGRVVQHARKDEFVFRIAIGCTGGTHRSVAACELLAYAIDADTLHLNL